MTDFLVYKKVTEKVKTKKANARLEIRAVYPIKNLSKFVYSSRSRSLGSPRGYSTAPEQIIKLKVVWMANLIRLFEKTSPCSRCLHGLQQNLLGINNQIILIKKKASMKFMVPSKAMGSEVE